MRVQRRLIGRLFIALVTFSGQAWVLSGCSDTDWKFQNQSPELAAIGAKSVTEGQRITFAVTATDKDHDTLTLWVDNLPPNALFADSGNGRGTFSFSPNYQQDSTLYSTFKVSDGHAVDSEVVAITIVDVAYTHQAGIITQNQTWAAADNPHLVAGDIEVDSGAVITIEPGCIVHFIEGRRIRVGYSSPGGLIADGTPDLKIRFTSVMPTPTPGIWDGLTFSSNCLSSSMLDNCIIEYGGGNGYGNIFIDNGAVSITDCTIRESSTNGIFFGGEGNAPDFDGNVITANHQYPVVVSCNRLGRLGGSSLTGNARDTLIVRGTLVSTSATWDTLGVPLRVTELFEIANGATLWLTAGSRLVFDKWAGIRVGRASAGTLVAEGTEVKQILMTSAEAAPLPGAWEGLSFYASAGSGCSMAHCLVLFGGQSQSGNIYVKDADVSIRNTTIRRSKQHGVYFDGNGRFSNFESNTITANTLNPVVISAAYAGRLPASNAYTGNGVDQILVLGSSLSENATWINLGIPYFVDTGQVRIDNGLTLTIAAEDTVYFGADAGITVGQTSSGTLIADGTDGRIVLSSNNPTSYWSGIRFMSHAQESSTLKFCTIAYGGSPRYKANVHLTDCRVVISDCLITNSNQDGIYFEGRSYALDFARNTITANKDYPVTIDCDYVGMLSPNNDYTANGKDGFRVGGSAITTSATWANPGVPLIIGTVITVNSGVQLTLSPSIVLNFDRDMGILVSADAALIADGSAGRITFTNNVAGSFWQGLVFLPGASPSSTLKSCHIRRGGAKSPGGTNRPGSVHVDSCAITITNCLIDSSNYNGVYFTGTGRANQFHGNTITGCVSYPVRINGGQADCLTTENDYTGNSGGDRDFIQIATQPVTNNVTWPRLPVPYYIDSLPSIAATLTLSPGISVQINKRGQIRFESSGTLIANGTPTDSITFTSRNPGTSSDNWGCIKLQGTGGTASSLQYCILERGGNFLKDPTGMVWLVNCKPTVSHCRLSNSRSYAVYREGTPYVTRADLQAGNTILPATPDPIYPAGQ